MFKDLSKRILAVALLVMASVSVSAQKTMSVNQYRRSNYDKQVKYNPYSINRKSQETKGYGIFFAEYNPHTWCYEDDFSSKTTNGYHGVSVGFTYFMPFGSPLGLDAGAKLQYLFRRETEQGVKETFEMLAATVPVSLAYDWTISDSFVLHPYAGVYGRYGISAKTQTEAAERRYTEDWMKSDHPMGGMKRFMGGWQVGASCRVSEVFSFGASYWMDFGKVTDYNKIRGFNIMLGATF